MKALEFFVVLGVIATLIGIADCGCNEECYSCNGREPGKCDEYCSKEGWCGNSQRHGNGNINNGDNCKDCATVEKCSWHGTAPFCEATCKDGWERSGPTRGDENGEYLWQSSGKKTTFGHYCWTGKKVWCCKFNKACAADSDCSGGKTCEEGFCSKDNCKVNDDDEACMDTFVFNGNTYSSCTKAGGYSKPWCYDVRGNNNWHWCTDCDYHRVHL